MCTYMHENMFMQTFRVQSFTIPQLNQATWPKCSCLGKSHAPGEKKFVAKIEGRKKHIIDMTGPGLLETPPDETQLKMGNHPYQQGRVIMILLMNNSSPDWGCMKPHESLEPTTSNAMNPWLTRYRHHCAPMDLSVFRSFSTQNSCWYLANQLVDTLSLIFDMGIHLR